MRRVAAFFLSALVVLVMGAVSAPGCAPTLSRPRTGWPATRDLTHVKNWWIFIGHNADVGSVNWRQQSIGADLVILNGDPHIPLADIPRETIRIGYLSIGEADARRGYWSTVRDQSFLVEPNPNWPENMRVDVRDKRWQEVILSEEAPRLIKLGFQGFMLDTLDTAPYLEARDPARFAGSRQALRELLRLLRSQFPQAVFVANATEALADAAPFVDGYLVEGLFATYDFQTSEYRATNDEERSWKLLQIQRALAVAQRPVFSIEYAAGERDLAFWAVAEANRRGVRPYVAAKDLNLFPR